MPTSTFDTPGAATYTVPANTTSITIEGWGAGGGGGSGETGAGSGDDGGGGGGGGYFSKVSTVSPGQSISYSIGTGGAGRALDSATDGGNGGATTVSTFSLTANGGTGGQAIDNGGAGGAGGTASGGDTNTTGDAGTSTAAGGNGGASPNGGAAQTTDGGNGNAPGGGAASSDETPGDAGDGANGRVSFTYTADAILDMTSYSRGSSSPLTWSHTVGTNTERLLTVGISIQDSNHANMVISGVTYGGVALTKIISNEAVGNNRTEWWYLLAPASGAANIVVTATGAVGELAAWGISYNTIDQTTPIESSSGATGNSSAPSVAMTTLTNNAHIASVCSAEAVFTANGTGQNTISTQTDQSFENARASWELKATAGSDTQSFTIASAQSWAMSSIVVRMSGQVAPEETPAVTSGNRTSNKRKQKKFIFLSDSYSGISNGVTGKWNFDSIIRMINGSAEVNIDTDKGLNQYNDEDIAINNSITIRVSSEKIGGQGIDYFSGYIASKALDSTGKQEKLAIRCFGHISKLFQAIWRVGTTISHDFTSGATVTNIVKQIIDNYRTLDTNSRISYVDSSALTITPTDDGWSGYQGGGDLTWATIRANAGNIKRAQADGTNESIAIRMGAASGWDIMRRGEFVSSSLNIPTGATITGAKFRAYVNSKVTTLGSQALTLCNGGPASTAIAASDYDGNVANTTVWGDSKTLDSINTNAYNEWNFDATGIAGLQAQIGSNFKFQLRFESERSNSEPGSFGAAKEASINWNYGNASSNKSELVITYTTSSIANNSIEDTSTSISDKYEGITFGDALNRAVARAYTASRQWYWRVLGDNIFTLKKTNTIPDHSFIYGKHISSIRISEDLINSVNEAFIYYGNTTIKRYKDSNNISLYGYISEFSRETNVDETTAGNIGNAIITGLTPPILKLSITINDTYDNAIETIDPGDVCEILNLPEEIYALLSDTMLITKTTYRKYEVDLEIQIEQQRVQSSIEQLRKEFNQSRSEGIPTTFSEG